MAALLEPPQPLLLKFHPDPLATLTSAHLDQLQDHSPKSNPDQHATQLMDAKLALLQPHWPKLNQDLLATLPMDV
jgi:hypothetical protein